MIEILHRNISLFVFFYKPKYRLNSVKALWFLLIFKYPLDRKISRATLIYYLELKIRNIQDLILLLLSLVGDLDGDLGDLDVDEEFVPLGPLLHSLHVVLLNARALHVEVGILNISYQGPILKKFTFMLPPPFLELYLFPKS